MAEHEREEDDRASSHARDTDADLVARLGAVVERYKIFYVAGAAIFVWWTRTIVVPLRESALTTVEVRRLNTKVDSVIVPRLDRADADRTRMIAIQENQSAILSLLTRLQCLKTNEIDRVKINLDCKDIPIDIPAPMMWDKNAKPK